MRPARSSASAELFTHEDKVFICRSLRNGYLNDGVKPSHSKYETLIDFIENRLKKPSKSQTKLDYYQSHLTTHQANGQLERVLAAFGSSGGKLNLDRLIEAHQLTLKTQTAQARIKSVAQWLLSADCDETIKAILKSKQEAKLQAESVKANKELIEQHKRKALLDEIEKSERKTKTTRSISKSLDMPIPKADWGRSKPAKLEDDGNSWREQI